MKKEWVKIEQGSYQLLVDEKPVGTMNFLGNGPGSGAKFESGSTTYFIKPEGFWKLRYKVTDQSGIELFSIRQAAKEQSFTIPEGTYQLKLHNNPLAEWVISDGEDILLSYGFTITGSKVKIGIKTARQQHNYLFDFLLWYIFLPVAMEELGEEWTFEN